MTGAAVLALALAAAPGGAPAEPRPLSVRARAERTAARLGEPFAYEIEVRHPPDERYALPDDLDLAPFRGSGGACRRAGDGEGVRTTCTLSLALFDLGPHDVPAVPLRVGTPGGEATLAVPGPRITGVGIIDPEAPPEALALRPPAPPVPLLVPSLRVLGWALALAGGVLAALALRRVLRRRARAVEARPPESPAARLVRRLDALEASRPPPRELFFALSGIVREFVGAVTGVNALDLTTGELAERLHRAADPRVDTAAVRRFCERADLVKYAREGADPRECAAAIAWARGLAARASAAAPRGAAGGPP